MLRTYGLLFSKLVVKVRMSDNRLFGDDLTVYHSMSQRLLGLLSGYD